jgi:hypothetical protein
MEFHGVRKGVRFFQLFFDVTAKKAAASWCRCLPPHFGHLTLSCSYSARVRRISNGFLQSTFPD